MLAPFPGGIVVKNLISPYEEIELQDGPGKKLFIDKSEEANGCLGKLTLDHWGFKAFVPKAAWKPLPPMLTGFLPGHDARLLSASTVDIELHFSQELDCDLVTKNLVVNSMDPFAKYVSPTVKIGEVNSGHWYQVAYETVINNPATDFLSHHICYGQNYHIQLSTPSCVCSLVHNHHIQHQDTQSSTCMATIGIHSY